MFDGGHDLDGAWAAVKSAVLSGIAIALFGILALPILVEIMLVMIFSMLIRKHWDHKHDILHTMRTCVESQVLPAIHSGYNQLKAQF